jgi:hypothetical protein
LEFVRTNEEKRWFGRIEDALVLRVMSLRRVSGNIKG